MTTFAALSRSFRAHNTKASLLANVGDDGFDGCITSHAFLAAAATPSGPSSTRVIVLILRRYLYVVRPTGPGAAGARCAAASRRLIIVSRSGSSEMSYAYVADMLLGKGVRPFEKVRPAWCRICRKPLIRPLSILPACSGHASPGVRAVREAGGHARELLVSAQLSLEASRASRPRHRPGREPEYD